MEKSKLGISVGLFGALLYFIGAVGGIWVVAIMMGYILLFESSEWLKRTAVKALIITVALSVSVVLIQHLLSSAAYSFNALQSLNNIIKNDPFSTNPNLSNLFSYIQYILTQILNVIQILIHVIFGFAAFKQKDIKIKVIDKILGKHFTNN